MIKPYVYDGGVLTAAPTIQGAVVPDLTTRLIKSAIVTNTTNAPVPFTLYAVPKTGTPNAAATVIPALPVPANQSINLDISTQGLNAGGTIQAMGLGLTFHYTALDFI